MLNDINYGRVNRTGIDIVLGHYLDLSRTLWCLALVYATKSFLSISSSSGTRSYSLGHLLGTAHQHTHRGREYR